MTVAPETRKVGRGRNEIVGGWISAGVAVLSALGLFLVSDPGSGYESWVWVLAPIMLLASAAAVWFGQRARQVGEEGGRWPVFIGFVIGGFFTLMLLATLVAHLVGFE